MANKFIIFFALAVAFVALAEADEDKPFPEPQEKPAYDKVKELVTKLDADLKAQIKEVSCANNVCLTPDTLEALTVREQPVAGINYHVKILAKEGDKTAYYHATIFEQRWTNTLKVTKVEGPKADSDPL